jgi:hypothetical protein
MASSALTGMAIHAAEDVLMVVSLVEGTVLDVTGYFLYVLPTHF